MIKSGENDIFDEKGLLKPQYELNDAQKSAINYFDSSVPKDNRTDFGKGIDFYTCDGKRVATMEEVYAYNELFYKSMLNKIDNHQMLNDVDNIKMHR